MTASDRTSQTAKRERIIQEMADNLDEELELELDDSKLDELLDETDALRPTVDRRLYFHELFRLQGELVKLQDWVQHQKQKVVVLFEGRDAAGKGGVIKRITQRLNPRVCRVVALPAPNERERTQWYFQRYVPHLPAAGEIVLFDRSWYNRAGVERVMGFCTDERVRGVLPLGARVRADAGALRHQADQVLVLDHRRGAAPALPDAHPRSAQAVEAVARWTSSRAAAGRTTPRPRKTMLERTHIPEAPWWVVEAVDKKRARLNCIAPPAEPDPLPGGRRTRRSCCRRACAIPTITAARSRRRCTCLRNTDGTRRVDRRASLPMRKARCPCRAI